MGCYFLFFTLFEIASCLSKMLAMALLLSVFGGGEVGGGAGEGGALSFPAGPEFGAEIPCKAFIKFKSANFSVILSSKYQIFVKIKPKFIA